MDWLRPPTDNLYKFVAISGLVILVASYVWPFQLRNDLQMKWFDYEKEYLKLNNDVGDAYDKSRNWLRQKDNEAIRDLGNGKTAKADANQLARANRMRVEMEELHEENIMTNEVDGRVKDDRQVQINHEMAYRKMLSLAHHAEQIYETQFGLPATRSDATQEAGQIPDQLMLLLKQMFFLTDRRKSAESVATAGFVVGSLAMLIGFFLWYWKVQRHQDAVLRQEAGTKEKTAK